MFQFSVGSSNSTPWKCKLTCSPFLVILFIFYSINCSSVSCDHQQHYLHVSPKEPNINEINLEVKSETVDIHYLYNISFNKLTTNLKSCMSNKNRALADCVYNSEKKWGPLSDDDIKSTCCSFWEADECLIKLVLSSCSTNQSKLYVNDQELTVNKKLLQDGYCSSYQEMSDCDFPFWLVVAIIVSLVILFFICGFAVLNNFMRR